MLLHKAITSKAITSTSTYIRSCKLGGGTIFPTPSSTKRRTNGKFEETLPWQTQQCESCRKRNSVANEWCAGELKYPSLSSCFLSSCQKAGKRTSKARFHYSWELVARNWNVCNYFPSLPQSSTNETCIHTAEGRVGEQLPWAMFAKTNKQTCTWFPFQHVCFALGFTVLPFITPTSSSLSLSPVKPKKSDIRQLMLFVVGFLNVYIHTFHNGTCLIFSA